jgi:hypothetical protein
MLLARPYTMTTPAVFLLLGALLAFGCGGDTALESGAALPLPEPAEIARIQSSIEGERDSGVARTDGYAEVLQFLAGIDSRWERTTESASGYRVSAAMSASDNTILLVQWIGDDWLGAFDMRGKINVRQPLAPEERDALLRSLGRDPGAIGGSGAEPVEPDQPGA